MKRLQTNKTGKSGRGMVNGHRSARTNGRSKSTPQGLSPFPKEVYQQNARIYKIMANPKRLEILNTLKSGELTVSQLSDVLGIREANTSQHLSVLRHVRLVKVRREGQNVYYSLTEPKLVDACRILRDIWADGSL